MYTLKINKHTHVTVFQKRSRLPCCRLFCQTQNENNHPSGRIGKRTNDPIAALNDPATMRQILLGYTEKLLALEAENKDMQPKALFADAVSASTSSILVGELAKIMRQNGIQTGQNRFFAWLRDNGYLIKRKGTDYNMPTQKSMELCLFEIKERTIVNPDDSTRITKTSKVTGKGQQYFINLFIGQDTDAFSAV